MSAPARAKLVKSVLIVSSGNFLEMYDFMVYGYYAAALARAYFPTGDAFASTMAVFATFGAGYLMRPIGALVLGAIIDRHGRRNGLLLTLGLMAVGTLTIAFTPSYARLGLAAPLIVLAGRLLQGLSAGVEIGGVSVYLAEIATPKTKGFLVSWQSASQQVAVMSAAGVGLIIGAALTKTQMQDWGWRIPFILGCALIPFLLLIRRRLEETEAFLSQTHRPSLSQIAWSVARHWRLVVPGAMMVTLTTVTFYAITAYTPTFGSQVLHLSMQSAFLVTLWVGLCNFVMLPLSGALSDRIGRKPILYTVAVLVLLTSYPAMHWLVQAPDFARLLTVELWLSVMFGAYNGAMVVYLTEVMPTQVRTSGFAMAYSLATGIFGGFTPFVCTWLIHATGDKAAPGLWLTAAAVMGLAGIAWLGRRKEA